MKTHDYKLEVASGQNQLYMKYSVEVEVLTFEVF
jgi:hypothetical protein